MKSPRKPDLPKESVTIMPIIWTEDYSVGVEQIDKQHRQLFQFVNSLENLLQQGIHSGPEVENLIMFLTTYTKTHFSFEESCMFKYGCSVSKKNKQEHSLFLDHYNETISRYHQEGPSKELLKELHDRISNWLISHICRVDIHLKSCQAHRKTDR